MRKKILAMAIALFTAVSANAQFEEGKTYVGGSLTGFNMKYTGSDKFCMGVQAQGGFSLPTTCCSMDRWATTTMAIRVFRTNIWQA